MKILCQNISKSFEGKSIFNQLNLEFDSGRHYALVGKNGSGKTTLLKIIAGFLTPDNGSVLWFENDKKIPTDKVYQKISFVAPYLELIDEYTVMELIHFHFSFKEYYPGLDKKNIISLLGFEEHQSKTVKSLSSGMKQKLQLGLALFSNSPLLLFDEPMSNLDEKNVLWFIEKVKSFATGRTMIICSNHNTLETSVCDTVIDIEKINS